MPKGRKKIPIEKMLFVFNRDNNTCQYCGKNGFRIFRWGKPCVVENPTNIILEKNKNYNSKNLIPFEIDHLLPLLKGGDDSIDNLVLSCRSCNRAKGYKII